MELNETKLTNAIKARRLRPAVTEEILAVGAQPGYGSPLGIPRDKVLLVVDDLVAISPNLVAGANKPGYHLRNTNYGRDYTADIVTDLVAVTDGYPCPTCGSPVYTSRGVEVGNIFKLGTKYSIAMGATYLDENGESKPIVMGSYGIGSERLMAVVIELHHDDNGIQWPITIAPYQVMLISLATEKTPEIAAAAERIYADLQAAGIEVLYDDRDERAGVKFNDADLLGIPIRLTVGGKGLKNGIVEMKLRRNGESRRTASRDHCPGGPGAYRRRDGPYPSPRRPHGFKGLIVNLAAHSEPNFPYYNVVDQIYHAEWAAAKLARLDLLAESIAALWPNGHPTRLIHVAGTGGKGSTCRFLEMGLSCFGKSGAFFSPHLFDYRERFSIGGEFASQADVMHTWEQRIRPFCTQSQPAQPGAHPYVPRGFHPHGACALGTARSGMGCARNRYRRPLRPDPRPRRGRLRPHQHRQRPRPHARLRALAARPR